MVILLDPIKVKFGIKVIGQDHRMKMFFFSAEGEITKCGSIMVTEKQT